MGRYAQAVTEGQREARVGRRASWGVVGLAACQSNNPQAASEAYQEAEEGERRQIRDKCLDADYKLTYGYFRSLK